MKKIKYFILVANILFLIACPPDYGEETIAIKNNSMQDISVFFAYYYNPQFKSTVYPDTALYSDPYWVCGNIKSGDEENFEIRLFAEHFRDAPSDTLCFFILSTDTIAKYDWETIRDEYRILKRYDLSYQNFKMLGNKIYYPPTEAMKNIKMWPPHQ